MTKIQIRRDTSTNWQQYNPTPSSGEPCYETDTGKLKIGNGTTPYNNLEYIGEGGEAYTLPPATADTLGGIKVGNNLSITDDGTLSATTVAPDNLVTTNTNQTITAPKIFNPDSTSEIKIGCSDSNYSGIGPYLMVNDSNNAFVITPNTLAMTGPTGGTSQSASALYFSNNNLPTSYADTYPTMDFRAKKSNQDADEATGFSLLLNGNIKTFKGSEEHYVIDTGNQSTLDDSNFNNADQLVRLDSSGKLPAIDGSQLTNLPGGSAPSNMVTTDTEQTITGIKTFQSSLKSDSIKSSSNSKYLSYNNDSGDTTIGNSTNSNLIVNGFPKFNQTNSYVFRMYGSAYTLQATTEELSIINYDTRNKVLKIGNTDSLVTNGNNEIFLTNANGGTIANLGMPSITQYTDGTLPLTGKTITATEAGYLYIDVTAAAVGEFIQVTVLDSSSKAVYSDDKYAVVADQSLKLLVPIPYGCYYTINYTASGTTNTYRFIKTTGQNI